MKWHNFLMDLSNLPPTFWIALAVVVFALYVLFDIARNTRP